MKKFLDINGVKVILDIVNEKLQEIEIPSLEQYVKIEDLDDYITNEELEQVREQIEDMIPSLENYVTKEELPEEYDDAEIKNRLSLLESKEDYDDSELKQSINSLETNKANKTEIPVIWKGTKIEYDLIQPKDPNTLYLIKEEA